MEGIIDDFNGDIFWNKKKSIKVIRGPFVLQKEQIFSINDLYYYRNLRYSSHPLKDLLKPKDETHGFIAEHLDLEVENKKLRANFIKLQKEVQIIRNKLKDTCNQVIDFQTFYS